MRLALLLLLAASTACATTREAGGPDPAHLVHIDSGPLVGATAPGVRVFRRIPYAAPPTGARRFQLPAPVEPWTKPRDATQRGPACPQPTAGGYLRATSEDCLTLDLWTPTTTTATTTAPLPVFVWIHGGAFLQGSGSDDLYDGARLALRTRAVVVTLNYRVGALGFLAHPAIARELGRSTTPALGLLDQRAALGWVQRNVAAFGGDPARVTVFGESAGAWSVCSHLASPGSRGLFARAIMESGACSDVLYFDHRRAEEQGLALAQAVGCTGPAALECLRAHSTDTLVQALPPKRGMLLSPGVWWGPIIDGVELPRAPLDALRSGDFAKVPLIIGWNRDEGVLHTISLPDVKLGEVTDFVRESFGARAAGAVPARYPRDTPQDVLTDVVTDAVFACNARRVARAVSGHGVPVYLYEWAHALDDPRPHDLGATHTVELFFVWGNQDFGIGLSEGERALSQVVMDAWGRLAWAGDPGSESLPWPRYEEASDRHLTLDVVPEVGSALKREVCDFWDGVEER